MPARRSDTKNGSGTQACRTKSRAHFISKLGDVEEELDESIYWMELLIESGHVEKQSVDRLIHEAEELLVMIVSSIKTARKNKNR